MDANGQKLVTKSDNDENQRGLLLTNEYQNGVLIKTTDAHGGVESYTTYSYNANNMLGTIASNTNDTFMNATVAETHIWTYNEANYPTKMIKIKNATDTTIVNFISDEKGNPIEEHWTKKNKEIETYYYYYNDKNLLSDVVRFNVRARRLLPDYTFEYNEVGNLVKSTQLPAGSSNYLIWQYTYLPNGLKDQEIAYNKQRTIIGKMKYEYISR